MRPLLLVVAALLPASSGAAESKPSDEAVLIGKIRARLNKIESMPAPADPEVKTALTDAEEALQPVAEIESFSVTGHKGKYLDLTIRTKRQRVPAAEAGSGVYAVRKVPKDKPSKPAPQKPDPATLPNACDTLACKAEEGVAKGGLGSLRAGASIFYGDAEGEYPKTLDALIPKYVGAIPAISVGGHAKTNKVRVVAAAAGKSAGAYVEDTGGWLYINDPGNPDLHGVIVIDCKHADYKGKALWSW
jgi:hypothetical protein